MSAAEHGPTTGRILAELSEQYDPFTGVTDADRPSDYGNTEPGISNRVIDATALILSCTHIDGEPSADALAELLTEIDNLKTAVANLDAVLVRPALMVLMEHGDEIETSEHVWSGKNRPISKTTDGARMLPVAVDLMCSPDNKTVDTETGEIETDRAAIVRQLPALVPMTASTKFKTTGAKALGLDLETYQDTPKGFKFTLLKKPKPVDDAEAVTQ